MIRPRRYFPWKIVAHYAVRAVLFHVILLFASGYSIRYYAAKTFLNSHDPAAALADFDEYLGGLALVLGGVLVAYVAWTSRLYFRPMGRVIQRARQLRRSPFAEMNGGETNGGEHEAGDADHDFDTDVMDEEPGEWADLERALARLHSDLHLKTDQLAREREELAALIAAVADAILAVDGDEAPLFFNSQFAGLFGVKSGAKPRRLAEIFRSPGVLKAFRDVLHEGVAKTVSLAVHTSRYPAARHFSLSVAPLRNKVDNRVYGAVGIFHDVTELKQAEQIRIEFVGNASHELRTPLTSIKGYVETLKDDVRAGRADDLAPFLDVVSKNVDRLILLVNDLLDLSTIESGGELRKTTVSTREVTDSVLRQLEVKRSRKQIEIRVEVGAETLLADPRRVEQVLMNLVHNAIKYIPERGRIDVRWSRTGESPGEGETILSVRDNGPGISSEHQARLFERFYRIDAGRSREQGGTGLGLAIVKHIMLKHGGRVQVQSRVGEGTEFICRFP